MHSWHAHPWLTGKRGDFWGQWLRAASCRLACVYLRGMGSRSPCFLMLAEEGTVPAPMLVVQNQRLAPTWVPTNGIIGITRPYS